LGQAATHTHAPHSHKQSPHFSHIISLPHTHIHSSPSFFNWSVFPVSSPQWSVAHHSFHAVIHSHTQPFISTRTSLFTPICQAHTCIPNPTIQVFTFTHIQHSHQFHFMPSITHNGATICWGNPFSRPAPTRPNQFSQGPPNFLAFHNTQQLSPQFTTFPFQFIFHNTPTFIFQFGPGFQHQLGPFPFIHHIWPPSTIWVPRLAMVLFHHQGSRPGFHPPQFFQRGPSRAIYTTHGKVPPTPLGPHFSTFKGFNHTTPQQGGAISPIFFSSFSPFQAKPPSFLAPTRATHFGPRQHSTHTTFHWHPTGPGQGFIHTPRHPTQQFTSGNSLAFFTHTQGTFPPHHKGNSIPGQLPTGQVSSQHIGSFLPHSTTTGHTYFLLTQPFPPPFRGPQFHWQAFQIQVVQGFQARQAIGPPIGHFPHWHSIFPPNQHFRAQGPTFDCTLFPPTKGAPHIFQGGLNTLGFFPPGLPTSVPGFPLHLGPFLRGPVHIPLLGVGFSSTGVGAGAFTPPHH